MVGVGIGVGVRVEDEVILDRSLMTGVGVEVVP